jgi:hypothetical protein
MFTMSTEFDDADDFSVQTCTCVFDALKGLSHMMDLAYVMYCIVSSRPK